MQIPNRSTIAARAMAGDPLGIPVWVKRRGNDEAAAVLQQWIFCLDQPGQELTIALDERGAPTAPKETTPMMTEDYMLKQQELTQQLAAMNLGEKAMKKAKKEHRKALIAENTTVVKHRLDIGWTLWLSLMGVGYTILSLAGHLPW